ncbi:polysaccharide deacetylase family protein [Paenibacillus sp. N1-5-1-14]|uniref:polysaccharide deacetylase family protein n=1 Tax=Paenibacillus radicibacter TaxID=2972488 RepID=UPI002159639C|nr:polysaccharide deacetylase family protein [Paenibacillus radicibacter]MCR8645140.1 polysaccharide deacetylase family protein [Paenibacillus radicibacter]
MTMQQEKMGFSPEDRLLIVNADDYGMCHTSNLAIQELLLSGAVSSATLMVPCPWAKEAAVFSRDHDHLDVGVHLTFTSEWPLYKWGPVSSLDSVYTLATHEGFFPETCFEFESHADAAHVRKEIFNQIEQAIAWGVDPTHLDIHMGSLYGLTTGKDFLETVFEACKYYELPLRLPRRFAGIHLLSQVALLAEKRVRSAEAKGIMIIDDLYQLPFATQAGETYEDVKLQMMNIIRGLRAGISEILIHPGTVTSELDAIMPYAAKREMERQLFLDPEIQELIAAEGIKKISYRNLRDAQRGLV